MTDRRIITHDELAVQLNIAVRTMPKVARQYLCSKLPQDRDRGAELLAAHILSGMVNFEITAPPVAGIPFGRLESGS